MKAELLTVQRRLERGLRRANRHPASCRLIAVSKTHSVTKIHQARRLGLTHFGESKVQEAREKFPEPQNRDKEETLHLIGALQTNKTRQALNHFDFIHTIDRPKLVDTIARIALEEKRCPDLLIQINTGEEPQKSGVMPQDLDALVNRVRLAKLPLVGFMCIPPSHQAPAPHFAWLAHRAKEFGLSELSMGMSQDFEAAAELGADLCAYRIRYFWYTGR